MGRIGLRAVCLAVALGPVAARAQSPAPLPLSLEAALQRVMADHPSLLAAEAGAQGAQARVEQARSKFYPSLDLVTELDYIKNYDNFSGITTTFNIPGFPQVGSFLSSLIEVDRDVPRYQAVPYLRLSYDLYSGGRDVALLDHNSLKRQAADVDQEIALQRVLYEVSLAYFRLRKACLQQDAAEQRTAFAEKKARLDQQRLDDGRLSEIEYRTSALALTEARIESKKRALDLVSGYEDYLGALDEEPPAAYVPEAMCRFASDVGTDLEVASIHGRDDVLQAAKNQLDVEAAGQRIKIARADYLPRLDFNVQYTEIGRSDHSALNSLDLHQRDTVLGLQLTYNLFDGFLTRNKVRESQAEENRLKLEGEKALNDIRTAQRRNEIGLRKTEYEIELARSHLELAQARQVLATRRLEDGRTSAIALEESQSEERDARSDVAIAEVDLAISKLAVWFPSAIAGTAGPRVPAGSQDRQSQP